MAGKAAGTIYGRFLELVSANWETLSPEDVIGFSPEELKIAGLSLNKALAILDLAEKSLVGELPDKKELSSLDRRNVSDFYSGKKGCTRHR